VRLLAERGSPCGLNGATIEPLVPLLTFIGSIELEKSIDNELVITDLESLKTTKLKTDISQSPKKKRRMHL